jgi:hypothetical protein
VTSLAWKQLEPFCKELTPGESFFGFELRGFEKSEEFFVGTEDELVIWLNHLQGCTIQTEIAQDYEISFKIGEGSSSEVFEAILFETNVKYWVK